MTFAEFLNAVGKDRLRSFIEDNNFQPIAASFHTELIDLLKIYYFVGGVGGIKTYNVTYLGFQTGDNELFIFKNDDTIKVKEYDGKFSKDGKKYQIPIKNFVASKKLKKK